MGCEPYPIAGSTLIVDFDTFDGGTGASITMTGLATTDIEIYKAGSTTQRASDNGYALLDTDGIDFDGITGIHGFSVDLSDNSDAGFYAVGSQYTIVVSSITVDGQTVNFIAGRFRIVSATRGLAGTALPDAAADAAGGLVVSDAGGLDADTVASNVAAILADTGTDGVVVAAGSKTGYSLAADQSAVTIGTVTTLTGHTAQTGDVYALANGASGFVALKGDTAAILLDTGTDGVVVAAASKTGYALSATGMDLVTLPAGIITATSIAAAAFNGKGDWLLSSADGSTFTAVPWNAAWDAEVQSEVDDGLKALYLQYLFHTTYDPASKPGSADALLNELIENDGGVSRYTANALEQAPSGGGGSTNNYDMHIDSWSIE